MEWSTLFFYIFAVLATGSAAMVVVASNPVHSVLFLMLTFVASSGVMILIGAEFIAMILIVVYVGAVAVLFLFVVMMLDIQASRVREHVARSLPWGSVIALMFLFSIGSAAYTIDRPLPASTESVDQVTNTEAIGYVLYTDYLIPFQIAGIILLVAMVGSIVLTLRHRKQVRRQDPLTQAVRRVEDTLEIHHVETGKGL